MRARKRIRMPSIDPPSLATTALIRRSRPFRKGPSLLKNCEEWLKPHVDVMPMQNMLGQWVLSEPVDGTLIQDGISYPRAWPAALIGGVIPEYMGEGWLYDLFVIHPTMSYAAKDIAYVGVTVYEYLERDMIAYMDSLSAYGYSEVFGGEQYDQLT